LTSEIIVNSVANSLVNRGGITFAYRAAEETGAGPEQIARAFVVARESFGLREYVANVEALDNKVPTTVQTRMYLEYRRLLDRAVRWFLQNRPGSVDVGAEIARFAEPVARLAGLVPGLLRGGEADRLQASVAEYVAAGVPEDFAMRCASILNVYSALDVVDLAEQLGESVDSVAEVYFATSEYFRIDEMLTMVSGLVREDRWDSLARGAMRDDLYAVLESLTHSALATTDPEQDGQTRLAAWAAANGPALERSRAAIGGLDALDSPGLAPLSVALRTLRGAARTGSSTA